MTKTYRRVAVSSGKLCLLVLLTALAACGGGKGINGDGPQPAADAPSFSELSALLDQEFARLGIDPERTAAAVFSGGTDPQVFDFSAETLGVGVAPETFLVELSWTERLVGDYDGNGRVTVNDLTPIGLNFGATVEYDPPALHQGFAFWPSGDAADDGPGQANWRLAMVDGNGDGVISIQDLTPIALHWQQRIEGYQIMRLAPGDETPQMLPNPEDASSPFTIARDESAGAALPRRYRFTLEEPCNGDFEYAYFVLPYADGDAGDSSDGRALNFSGCEAVPIARLSADVQSGAAPLTVNFDAAASSDLDGSIIKYELDFGEGGGFELLAEPTASREYTLPGDYTVWLRVTDDSSQVSVSQPLSISVSEPGANMDPVAALTASTLTGVSAPLLVTLDASTSSDPEGDELSFSWDFGDQTIDGSGGVPTPIHTYTSDGAFEAVVTVSDGNGGSSTASVTIRIGNPPTARVLAGPLEGNGPLVVTFSAGASSDVAPGSISNYLWDWDNDGTVDEDSGTDAVVTHEYTEPGYYQARLTVQDDSGLTHTTTVAQNGKPMLVHVNAPPTVELSGSPDSGDFPLQVNYSSVAADSDGVIADYDWDFDNDGVFNEDDNGEDAGHGWSGLTWGYDAAGLRSISIRVTDNLGGQATDSFEVNVTENQAPVAVLTGGPLVGVSPHEVNFDASGSTDDHAVVGYEWDWDNDGNFDTLPDPAPQASHIFNGGGEHTATVRVSDASGLTDTQSVTLTLDRWVHTWGSDQPENITALLQDPAGDLYAIGTVELTASNIDTLILKFAQDGSLSWAQRWGGAGNDIANAACFDSSGNLIICGDSNSFTGNKGFVISLSGVPELNWQYQWTTANGSHLSGIFSHSNGKLVLAGDRSDDAGRDATLLSLLEDGSIDWQKYWAKNQATELFYSATQDQDGNIYAVGSRFDDVSANSLNALVVKVSDAGVLAWDRQYDRLDKDDVARSVAYDASIGALYVGGFSETTSNVASGDALLLQFDTSGTLGVQSFWGGNQRDAVQQLFVGPLGSVQVAAFTDSFSAERTGTILSFSSGLASLDQVLRYSAGSDSSIGGMTLEAGGAYCLAGTTAAVPGSITDFSAATFGPLAGDVQSDLGAVGDVTATMTEIDGVLTAASGQLDTAQDEGAAFVLRWFP